MTPSEAFWFGVFMGFISGAGVVGLLGLMLG